MSDQGVVLPPETVAPQPPAHNAFRGPNGIRAGWRVLIFFLVLAALILLVSLPFAIMARLSGKPSVGVGFGMSGLTPLGLGVSEGTLFFFTAIAALIMARIERRKFGQYGLPARFAFGKDFWIGLVVGFLGISAALLGIFALHGFRLTGIATHGSTLLAATAAWSATFVIVGLAEEFSFRGYLQYTLTTGMRFWPSAILLSLLFGLAHAGNPGETKLGLFSVVLFGLLFCFFLRRTGNLWWAATRDGTGARRFSMAFPIAAFPPTTTCSTAPSTARRGSPEGASARRPASSRRSCSRWLQFCSAVYTARGNTSRAINRGEREYRRRASPRLGQPRACPERSRRAAVSTRIFRGSPPRPRVPADSTSKPSPHWRRPAGFWSRAPFPAPASRSRSAHLPP